MEFKLAWIVGPAVAIAFGFVGLFWQIETQGQHFASNYLSIREHSEFKESVRHEIDLARNSSEQKSIDLQRQLDLVTNALRLQMEEKIKDLQTQIEELRRKQMK